MPMMQALLGNLDHQWSAAQNKINGPGTAATIWKTAVLRDVINQTAVRRMNAATNGCVSINGAVLRSLMKNKCSKSRPV